MYAYAARSRARDITYERANETERNTVRGSVCTRGDELEWEEPVWTRRRTRYLIRGLLSREINWRLWVRWVALAVSLLYTRESVLARDRERVEARRRTPGYTQRERETGRRDSESGPESQGAAAERVCLTNEPRDADDLVRGSRASVTRRLTFA